MSMGFSRWLCTYNSKSTLVKIVHPGGHIELHDRPVLAAEIMLRNPRCCVAYPNVFRQPRAIVAPNTMLMQGQKFYIVPLGTIRKLQRLSRSPLQSHQTPSPSSSSDASQTNYDQERMISSCWLCFAQNTSKQPYTCLEQSDGDKCTATNGTPETRMPKEMEKEEFASDEYCFMCLFTGIKSMRMQTEMSKAMMHNVAVVVELNPLK
ncbi:hypothetical protein Scep_008592 [Stephania cephalantha]|uniref:Uncharacterized protein n=1 Tax=Stephania cephalantha TaxID=152367 RepID=A0AAP0KEQ1_9MAGN